ncbi:hypothetical protein M0R45_008989 [Rubus argutus]|uniref:Uncharacterized protein n=1 Tax=Rubus argutus TaxID=59490 RepID=A0AAW1Y598_RUBAR
MEDLDEEGDELLNLSLAIVTNSGGERMKKRREGMRILASSSSVISAQPWRILPSCTKVFPCVATRCKRVVAYFADGLAARLLTRKSPFYDMILNEPTHEEEFVAFTRPLPDPPPPTTSLLILQPTRP